MESERYWKYNFQEVIKMDNQVKIGGRIWHLRKEVMHKTQEEFAELLDVTPEAVGLWERGIVFPSIHNIARIAERCGVSSDYLLGIKSPVSKSK